MAHVLGNKFCIESLCCDVSDLQEVVNDVFSRVGPVRFPSWKYPDKTSCDLDVTGLLETCEYSDDEEESNQLAHIVLLELVIDRLVLLLQSMSRHTDMILSGGRGASAAPAQSNTSVGLVVKKYWNKLVQIGTQMQKVTSENKNKSRTVHDLENTMTKLLQNDRKHSASGVHVTIPLNESDASRLMNGSVASNYSISQDECNKSTQTMETAFVPCDSCDVVQRHLRDVGDVVINVCTTQDLPSSLSSHRAKLSKLEWMTGTDVARWATEQNKDLVRMNKYLGGLHAQIEPLEKDLAQERKTNKQLHARMAQCAKEVVLEKETQSIQQKQHETKIQETEEKTKEEVSRVQRINNSLLKNKEQLEKQMDTMRMELNRQQRLIKEIDAAKEKAIADMELKMTSNEKVHNLEARIENYEEQLDSIQEKLAKSERDLTREQARNKSVHKHSESLQGKQESLVQRLDTLDQENEELRNEVSDLEEQKEKLEDKVYELKEEKKEIRTQLIEQQSFVKTLTRERDILASQTEELQAAIELTEKKLEEALEQQRLIVEYPDLNGPVNPDLVGTGDLATDMENQVRANSVRISLLEEQNVKLRNSITKMLQTRGKPTTQTMPSKPVPLWNLDESRQDVNQESSSLQNRPARLTETPVEAHRDPPPRWKSAGADRPRQKASPPDSCARKANSAGHVRQSFVVGKSPKPPRPQSKTKGSLAKGAKVVDTQGGSTIGAYLQLKKAGLLKPASGKSYPGGNITSSPSGENCYYVPSETFSCQKCDKMYSNTRELDIHKSYCYGGT